MPRTQNNGGRHSIAIKDPVYSGRNFRSCWEFVLKHGGNIDGFFSGINIPRDRLLDENEWFNIRVAVKVWKNYRACIRDYNMCDNYLLGFEALQTAAYGVAIIAGQLSSMRYIVKKLPNLLSTISKIDLLDVIELGKDRAVIGYRIHEGFEEYLDSSFTNLFLGTFAGIPTLHHMPPAEVREIASCIDVFKKFSIDFSQFGHRIEKRDDIVYLDGERAGRWIEIESEKEIHPIAKNHMKGEACILWEKDVVDKTGLGREVVIARKGDLYNCSKSLFYMQWENAPFTRRIKRFFDQSSIYVLAWSKSKDNLIQKASQFQENVKILEERVEERTQELRETQAKLIESEKRTLEHRITGGFAHEMRNALAGAQLEFKTTLNYKDRGKPSAEILKDSATTLLKNISLIHEKYNIPREEIATLLLPELKTIAEIADHLAGVHADVSSDLDRGLSITTQIRDYAKMSELKPGNAPIDVVPLLRSYKDRYKQDFQRIGITYLVEGIEEAVVKAEEIHLDSIFGNLIRNAKDALEEVETERPKEIKVTVEMKDDQSENAFVITVADNGPGIPEENLHELFEPFYSTKPTTGTGLGLGVVKRLVQLYDGTIEVESKVGEGTRFAVTLPYHI